MNFSVQGMKDAFTARIQTIATKAQQLQAQQGQIDNAEYLHSEAYAIKAQEIGEVKSRTSEAAALHSMREVAKASFQKGDSLSMRPDKVRDLIGTVIACTMQTLPPGDWAFRPLLEEVKSKNITTAMCALLAHRCLLQLLPPEKQSAEVLAVVQTVMNYLSDDKWLHVIFALQYVRAMWTPDIAPMVLGQPYQEVGDKNITVMKILLPADPAKLKPALHNRNVQKNALATFERFLQMDAHGSIIDFDVTHAVTDIVERCSKADATLALASMNCMVAMCRGGVDDARRSKCLPVVTRLMQLAVRGSPPFQSAAKVAGAPTGSAGASGVPAPFIAACLTALRLMCAGNRAALAQAKPVVKEALRLDATAAKDGHAMNFAFGVVTEAVRFVGAVPLDVELVHSGAQAVERVFLASRASSANSHALKYMGLRCLAVLVPGTPTIALSETFRQEIGNGLTSGDESLRVKTAELLLSMCNEHNMESISNQILAVIRQASDDAMKASFCVQLVAKAEIHTPPHNPNFFHQIVVQLLQAGDFTPHSVVEKTIEVIAEAEDPAIQSAAVDACLEALSKGDSMSNGLLEVVFWVLGEYGTQGSARLSHAAAMSQLQTVLTSTSLTRELEGVAITAISKLAAAGGLTEAQVPPAILAWMGARRHSRCLDHQLRSSLFFKLIAPGGSSMMPRRRPQAEDDASPASFPALEALAQQQAAEGRPVYQSAEARVLAAVMPSANRALKTAAYAAPTPAAPPPAAPQRYHDPIAAVADLSIRDSRPVEGGVASSSHATITHPAAGAARPVATQPAGKWARMHAERNSPAAAPAAPARAAPSAAPAAAAARVDAPPSPSAGPDPLGLFAGLDGASRSPPKARRAPAPHLQPAAAPAAVPDLLDLGSVSPPRSPAKAAPGPANSAVDAMDLLMGFDAPPNGAGEQAGAVDDASLLNLDALDHGPGPAAPLPSPAATGPQLVFGLPGAGSLPPVGEVAAPGAQKQPPLAPAPKKKDAFADLLSF